MKYLIFLMLVSCTPKVITPCERQLELCKMGQEILRAACEKQQRPIDEECFKGCFQQIENK